MTGEKKTRLGWCRRHKRDMFFNLSVSRSIDDGEGGEVLAWECSGDCGERCLDEPLPPRIAQTGFHAEKRPRL